MAEIFWKLRSYWISVTHKERDRKWRKRERMECLNNSVCRSQCVSSEGGGDSKQSIRECVTIPVDHFSKEYEVEIVCIRKGKSVTAAHSWSWTHSSVCEMTWTASCRVVFLSLSLASFLLYSISPFPSALSCSRIIFKTGVKVPFFVYFSSFSLFTIISSIIMNWHEKATWIVCQSYINTRFLSPFLS